MSKLLPMKCDWMSEIAPVYYPMFKPNPVLSKTFDCICESIAMRHAAAAAAAAVTAAAAASAASTAASADGDSSSGGSGTSRMAMAAKMMTPVRKVTARCLDIGCGVGRDSVWLALQNYRSPSNGIEIEWQALGIDRNDTGLENMEQLAEMSETIDQIRVQKVRIRKDYTIICFDENYYDDDDKKCDDDTDATAEHGDDGKEKEKEKKEEDGKGILFIFFSISLNLNQSRSANKIKNSCAWFALS